MAEHKHETIIEVDQEEAAFTIEPAQVEIGSGYTLCVKYDENENPLVDVKTYGQVDMTKLLKEIKKAFPNAQIRQLNQNQPVIVTKKTKKHKKKPK